MGARGAGAEAALLLCDDRAETERTYCFTTVCNQTRRLLEGLLEVVLEALVLVLFGAQLHELAWRHRQVTGSASHSNRDVTDAKNYRIQRTRSV